MLRSRRKNKESKEKREKGGKTFLGRRFLASAFRGSTVQKILSRVSLFFPPDFESRRAYHSQPIINCAWRNILTASFLPVFKPVQKKEKGKKGQEKEIERERGASMKYRKRKVNERESEAKVRRFGEERGGESGVG